MFHRQHRGKVTGVAFNPLSPHLYSCGSVGSLALHDTGDDKYQLMRLLTNAVARGDARSPHTLTVSGDSRHVAFVGPTDFTVSVVDAKSLDEVNYFDFSLHDYIDTAQCVYVHTAHNVLCDS